MSFSEMNEIELVELPAHRIFEELGYQTLEGTDVTSERQSYSDVILTTRLERKIRELNPDLPEIVYETTINQVKSLSNPSTIQNNQEFTKCFLPE